MKKLNFTLCITMLWTTISAASLLAIEIPNVVSDTITFDLSKATEVSYANVVKDKILFLPTGITLEQGATRGIFKSGIILASIPFSDVGVHWNAELPIGTSILIEVKTSKNNEVWTEWQEVNIESFPDQNAEQEFWGYLIGVDQKDRTHKFIQCRVTLISVDRELEILSPILNRIQFTFIDAGITPPSLLEEIKQRVEKDNLRIRLYARSASYPKPSIVSRAGWGCDENKRKGTPEYETVTHIIIHHTDTPNSDTDWAARIRAIYLYHVNPPPDGRGWNDIGYNYLVDPNGVLYEGRYGGDDVIGAHASGYNDGTMGVAFLGSYGGGTFGGNTHPSQAMLNSAEKLLAWKCDQRNINPLGSGPDNDGAVYPYICGHRDVDPGNICPGGNLYTLLPSIREHVRNLIEGPSTNNPPVAEAAVSTNPNGPYYGYENPLLVIKGQNVTLYFFTDKDVNGDGKASYDPDGWTDPENGVSSGGKAEWNTDLNQGAPTFEKVISNPFSPSACNIGPFSYTFNDPPGTYEYQILRITDRKGVQSNVSKIRIQVIDKGTECFFADLNCDGKVDTEDVRRIALHWDTRVGDDLYNSDYDFNHDGRINLLDVRMVAQYWGQNAPFSPASPSIAHVNSNPREVIAYLQENLPEVRIGKIATIEEKFQGMELHLSYDPQKLKATHAGLEKRFSFIILGPRINQKQGTVAIGAVLLDKQEISALTSEILSAIKFTALEERDSAPHIFALGQNFPNPFNPDTWIPYQLAESSNVRIAICNVSGQLIRNLDLGYKDAGYYQDKVSAAYWNGRNETGEKVASGIYFYSIKAGNFIATRKMLLRE